MPDIEHGNIVSLSDLATAAQEAADILEDPEEYDEDEVQDAKEYIQTVAKFVNESSYTADENDPDSVVDALNSLGQDEDSLIADDHFTDYCAELVKDLGYLPDNLAPFIENNIDWDGVATDLKADYSSLTLDGSDYWHRDS